jgi:hypothetical protein
MLGLGSLIDIGEKIMPKNSTLKFILIPVQRTGMFLVI